MPFLYSEEVALEEIFFFLYRKEVHYCNGKRKSLPIKTSTVVLKSIH